MAKCNECPLLKDCKISFFNEGIPLCFSAEALTNYLPYVSKNTVYVGTKLAIVRKEK